MTASSHLAVTVIVTAHEGSHSGALDHARRQTGVDVAVERAAVTRGHSAAAARAAAVGRARTPWLAFLDEGDLWAPDRLARTLEAAEQAGAPWAYGAAVLLDAVGGVRGVRLAELPESLPTRLRAHNVVGGLSCAVVRADLLERAGGLDRGFRVHDAWELWLRLAGIAAPAAVAEPLVAEREIGPGVARIQEPGRALTEYGRLAQAGRIDARGAAYRMWLAADLSAAGRPRRAATVLLAGAARHRRPQDVLRAQRALRGRSSGSPTAYAPPRWLTAARA
jgi:hypothetical protein